MRCSPSWRVTLRLGEALGAFFGFLELPIAIGEIFELFLQAAQLVAELAVARDHEPDRAAGGAEQRGSADRESVRIVIGRAVDRGQEAERGRKRHRQHGGGAHEEQQRAKARDATQLRPDAGNRLHVRRPAAGVFRGAPSAAPGSLLSLVVARSCPGTLCDSLRRLRTRRA
jgi:hypothetical protein